MERLRLLQADVIGHGLGRSRHQPAFVGEQ